MGAIVATLSWPGLARPPTTGGADRGKDVDGRHRAGHDTGGAGHDMEGAGDHDMGGAGPAKLAPVRAGRTMTEQGVARFRLPGEEGAAGRMGSGGVFKPDQT